MNNSIYKVPPPPGADGKQDLNDPYFKLYGGVDYSVPPPPDANGIQNKNDPFYQFDWSFFSNLDW